MTLENSKGREQERSTATDEAKLLKAGRVASLAGILTSIGLPTAFVHTIICGGTSILGTASYVASLGLDAFIFVPDWVRTTSTGLFVASTTFLAVSLFKKSRDKK